MTESSDDSARDAVARRDAIAQRLASVVTDRHNRVQFSMTTVGRAMIDDLVAQGIYGRSRGEVCRRFVEERLQTFIQKRPLKSNAV